MAARDAKSDEEDDHDDDPSSEWDGQEDDGFDLHPLARMAKGSGKGKSGKRCFKCGGGSRPALKRSRNSYGN